MDTSPWLREYLDSQFANTHTTLAEIKGRLEEVEVRVATTNGQLSAHRFRLESLESAAIDPNKLPAMTVSERRVVARAAKIAVAVCGLLWGTLEGAARIWPHLLPAFVTLGLLTP